MDQILPNFDQTLTLEWTIVHVTKSGLSIRVENVLKGSLDLIPSPSSSVKIHIMVGKVCLRCKGKH